MADLFEIEGMVRKPDHPTSIAAAAKVKRVTIRALVEREAIMAGPRGIIDDELKATYPDRPESSFRKRRTELTQENHLLDTGRTRVNRQGQEEKVWMHRDFHHAPPPVKEREKPVSKSDRLVRLEAQKTDLLDMVALALPYVEEAVHDPVYSSEGVTRIRQLANRIKKTIEREERTKND